MTDNNKPEHLISEELVNSLNIILMDTLYIVSNIYAQSPKTLKQLLISILVVPDAAIQFKESLNNSNDELKQLSSEEKTALDSLCYAIAALSSLIHDGAPKIGEILNKPNISDMEAEAISSLTKAAIVTAAKTVSLDNNQQ